MDPRKDQPGALIVELKSHRGPFQVPFPCFIPVIPPVRFHNQSAEIVPDHSYHYLRELRDDKAFVPVFTELLHARIYITDHDLAGAALVMTVHLISEMHTLFQSLGAHGRPNNLLFDPSAKHEGWQVLFDDFPSTDFEPPTFH